MQVCKDRWFEPGSYLIFQLSLDIGAEPVGLIKEILITDGSYASFVQLCTIEKCIMNLNCLQITLEQELTYIKFEDLKFKQPHLAKYISNFLYLQVRYFHHLISKI